MDTILELKKQIEKVILLLEQRLVDDPDRPILKTLYDRYVKAEEILTNNDNIKKIMIVGGCRAYLDAFSDYMNPLLIEMDKAEKMFADLILRNIQQNQCIDSRNESGISQSQNRSSTGMFTGGDYFT